MVHPPRRLDGVDRWLVGMVARQELERPSVFDERRRRCAPVRSCEKRNDLSSGERGTFRLEEIDNRAYEVSLQRCPPLRTGTIAANMCTQSVGSTTARSA